MVTSIKNSILEIFQSIEHGKETYAQLSQLFKACFNITREFLYKNQNKYGFLNNGQDYDCNDAIMSLLRKVKEF
ncbi:MAG: hypothetical protein C4539_00680 [Ignavibacteriales bacterium]|nr:MAG: hypothetical protein C4539_00680 [Ignavibacteriales bacterium]